MKILIAETDPNIRYGLNLLLEQVEDRIVMDEVTNKQELFGRVYAACPDVLLISQIFPGLDNGRLLEELHQFCPSLTIVVLNASLPGKEIKLPAHIGRNIEVIQKPEQLFNLLIKIKRAHQPGTTEKK
jgi:DNA-binding NarL/FixJ family response regulator